MQFPIALRTYARRYRYVLGGAVLIIVGGFFFLGSGESSDATLVIEAGDFAKQVSVSGTVTAARSVDLGFAANGRIVGAYARVGERVPAGAVLAEVENGDLAATLAQKRAELAALIAGSRPEEVAIAAAKVVSARAALVDSIQGAYTASDDAIHNTIDSFFQNPRTNPWLPFSVSDSVLKASVERERFALESVLGDWASLVSKLTGETAAERGQVAQAYLAQVTTFLANANAVINRAVPDQEYTVAELAAYAADLSVVRSSVNGAAVALTRDIAALVAAEKDLALKEAGTTREDLAAAEAAVENARAALAKTRVVAPFSGLVTRMDAKVGQTVSPSASEISMQSDGLFQLEVFVPEVSIAGIAVGNPATTTLDAYGSAVEFPTRVVSVDPAETLRDGVPTYKTTLVFLSPDTRIRSGMTASVRITTGVLPRAIVIPSGAVGRDTEGQFVSVLENGAPVRRAVETGVSPALGQVEIVSGLMEGDTILLAPAS